jgi:hypothetical protein
MGFRSFAHIPLGSNNSEYTVTLFMVFYSVPQSVGLFKWQNKNARFFLLMFKLCIVFYLVAEKLSYIQMAKW